MIHDSISKDARRSQVFTEAANRGLFSCEFCKSFKNTFFYETPLVAASVLALFCAHVCTDTACEG